MSVILLILKIIGIVLLVLLGLLVLFLCAVIFYPAGYRISGSFEEELELHARLHWLFHLFRFSFRIVGEEKRAVLYILGIPKQIYPAVEKKEKRHRRKKRRSQSDAPGEKTYDWEMEEEDGEEAVLQTMQMTSIETENVMSSEKDILREEITLPDKISSWKRFQQKIKQIFRKIRSFFQTLPAKVRSVYSNFSKWKGIFTDEANRASVRLFYSEIKYLAFHYKPRRVKADIRYGLGDPALTGKSLAVLSMIPFLYKKKVQIVPDFETEKFFVEGNLDAGGYIRIFHLIRSGLHIWKDDNCKKFIRKLRQ